MAAYNLRVLLPLLVLRRNAQAKPMTLLSLESGARFEVPWAPEEADYDGLGATFGAVDRPGRMAMLARAGDGLPTWSWALELDGRDYGESVEPALVALGNLLRSGDRVVVSRANLAPGPWRITAAPVHVRRLTPDQRVNAATVSLTFTRASDAVVGIGPMTGGAGQPGKPAPAPSSPPAPAPAPTTRTYTVVRGDTPSGIAGRLYGNPARWRELLDANGVRDPRKLPVGKVLRVP